MRINRRLTTFGIFYLLTSLAGTFGAYATKGAPVAIGTMIFAALFALPTFRFVLQLESKRLKREHNGLQQTEGK